MNYLKKSILKFVICTALLLGMTGSIFPVAAEDEAQPTEEVSVPVETAAYEKLLALDLADETTEENLTKPVTKTEFCKLLTKFANLPADSVNYDEESPFSDITRLNNDYEYVYAANLYGLIKGYPGAELKPEEFVDSVYAQVVLVRLLGYEVTAEYNGGYPTGYLSLATELRVAKNAAKSGTLLLQDIYQMLCNTLDAKIYKQTEYGDDNKYEQGDTYAAEILEIYSVNGTMEQNTVTSIYRPLNKSDAKNIVVGDTTLRCRTDKYNEFLGVDVKAWYKDTGSCDEVVYIEKRNSGKSDIVKVSGGDITKVDGNSVKYEDENEKTHSVKISSTPNIIYNGVFYSGYGDLETLMKEADEVVFVSSDDNYEVVKINKYAHGLVNGIDKDTDTIFIRDGSQFQADFDDCFGGIYAADGTKMQIDDLKNDFVISMLISKNEKGVKYTAVYVSQDVVTAKLDVIENDDTYVFGGRKLKRADNFTDTLDIGSSYVVYIGLGDKIVYAERSLQDSYKFGILVKAYCDQKIGTEAEMKIFTQNGTFEVLPVSDKIEINGTHYKLNKDSNSIKTKFNAFSPDMPIAYKIDAEKKISEMLIPDAAAQNTDNKMTELHSSTGYTFANYNIDLACMYDTDTVIFNIPDVSATGNEKRYKIFSTLTEGLAKLQAYKINTGKIPVADIIVLTSSGNSRLKVEDYNGGFTHFGVLTKFVQALDSEENETQKLVISDGTEKEYFLYNEEYLTDTPLKKGDVVVYTVDPSDSETISDFKLIYREGDTSDGYLIPGVKHNRTYSASANIDFLLGNVEYTDGEYLLYNTWDDNNSFADVQRVLPFGTATLCVYDKANNKVSPAGTADMIKGRKLIVYRGYRGVPKCFIVFKE